MHVYVYVYMYIYIYICMYNPIIRPISRVSQVMSGVYAESRCMLDLQVGYASTPPVAGEDAGTLMAIQPLLGAT